MEAAAKRASLLIRFRGPGGPKFQGSGPPGALPSVVPRASKVPPPDLLLSQCTCSTNRPHFGEREQRERIASPSIRVCRRRPSSIRIAPPAARSPVAGRLAAEGVPRTGHTRRPAKLSDFFQGFGVGNEEILRAGLGIPDVERHKRGKDFGVLNLPADVIAGQARLLVAVACREVG